MGAQFLGIDGDILTFKVSGRVGKAELEAAQRLAAEAIRSHGPVRVLVIGEDFQGWGRGGDWGDLSFQIDNDRYIQRMAFVGEKEWEELVLLFAGRGLRGFPIEYFLPADEARARAWLAASDRNP